MIHLLTSFFLALANRPRLERAAKALLLLLLLLRPDGVSAELKVQANCRRAMPGRIRSTVNGVEWFHDEWHAEVHSLGGRTQLSMRKNVVQLNKLSSKPRLKFGIKQSDRTMAFSW